MPNTDGAKATDLRDQVQAMKTPGVITTQDGTTAQTGGQTKPATPGLWARLTQGVRYTLTGEPLGWFGPGQPIKPVAQEQTQGRRYDFPTGINYRIRPRSEESTSFDDLRNLADSYDLLRLVIETRKDQLAKLEWEIRMRDQKAAPDEKRLRKLREIFRYPDNENDFATWFRAVIEDMLVIDAPAIEPRFNALGEIVALDWIDGATIRRVIDEYGRTPLPPNPAFQQILKGVPANDFSRDQLIYKPRNLRSHKLYGYSPVEQVIVTVNIAMRRQVWQLQGYTEGNIPEAIIEMPENWNIDQVQQFQAWFDSMLEGNTAERRHMKFIPGPAKITPTKPTDFKDEYDEWLARVVCYAFSVSPQWAVKELNRATAQTAQEQALSEGLAPMMLWGKGLFDYIIERYFGWTDIEFVWKLEKNIDELKRAQAHEIYVRNAVMSIDEVREELGKEALGVPQGILTPQGFIALPTRDQPGLLATATEETPAEAPVEGAPTGEAEQPDKLSIDTSTGLVGLDLEGRKKRATPKKGTRVIRIERPDYSVEQGALKSVIHKLLQDAKPIVIEQAVKAYDRIGKASGSRVDRILAEIEMDGWAVAFDDIESHLEEIAKRSGASAVAAMGIVEDLDAMLSLVNEAAVEYASERAAELVGMSWIDGELVPNPNPEFAISEATREMLRGDITLATEEGMSTGELGNLLEDSYGFSSQRADTIARTETAFAHSGGRYASEQLSGIVSQKRNMMGSEHDKDDICDDATADGWIPFDQEFSSGALYPPHHPNCVCDYEVALVGEEHEEESESWLNTEGLEE